VEATPDYSWVFSGPETRREELGESGRAKTSDLIKLNSSGPVTIPDSRIPRRRCQRKKKEEKKDERGRKKNETKKRRPIMANRHAFQKTACTGGKSAGERKKL